MARILFCFDEYETDRQVEDFHKEIQPDLTRTGHKVFCAGQAEVFEKLVELQPDYLILVALMRKSASWEIARRLRSAREAERPNVAILMVIRYGPEDSLDSPAYYALPEYQELYDSYYPGFGFDEWIEGFEAGLYGGGMMSAQRNWDQFALLLIDVQRDFWSEQLAPSFPDFPANMDRLLALCRSEGLEIVHLRASFKPDMSDWMLRYRLRGRIPCIEGTEGVETLRFATKKPGEIVIVKQTFDGFHNPDLLPYLRRKGKRFLLTAGLLTSVCVFLTTASAAQLGFLVAVVEDCCADEPFIHEHTLERYQFIFDRTTTDAICGDHSKWLAALEELE